MYVFTLYTEVNYKRLGVVKLSNVCKYVFVNMLINDNIFNRFYTLCNLATFSYLLKISVFIYKYLHYADT